MKRISICLIILSVLFMSRSLCGQDIVDYKSISGSWLGKLQAGGISLRVIFNLTLIGTDSLAATLDSPDQGAKNIKIGPVKFNGKDINILAPLLRGEYKGTVKNDTLIAGTWTQGGVSNPLDLSKLKAVFTLNRPQEPKPPFPYKSEDVIFKNNKADIDLAGTLTIPKGDGPFPAVILITGSGLQNRNEELFGHKPFLVIADYLTRNGIAVLRYDDRGVGQSKGTPLNATSADFATDAEAAFLYLKTRNEVKPESIGFAGHSEGALIAPIIASSSHEVAFIISLAGMGISGVKITDSQIMNIGRQSGINEKELKKSVADNRKIINALIKEPDNDIALVKMTEVYKKMLVKQKKSPEEIESALNQFKRTNNPLNFTWTRYYFRTDPSEFWKKVKCPVLALNGEKDLQVAADINLPAIEKALKSGGNQSVKTISFPGLNHLFQHCKTGMVTEYGDIEETFSPEVLKTMADWILQL